MKKHSIIASIVIILLLIGLSIGFYGCKKSVRTTEDNDEAKDALTETDTAVPAEGEQVVPAPMPEATGVFPAPEPEQESEPSSATSPTSTIGTAAQDAVQNETITPVPVAPVQEPNQNPTNPTEQLVQETQQLVARSQRLLPDFKPGVSVHFIDIGMGDATLVRVGKRNILVDCGSYATRQQVVQYLTDAGVRRLDALVISSPRQEHVGGCDYVLQYLDVDKVYDNGLDSSSDEYKMFFSTLEDGNYEHISLHEPLTLDFIDLQDTRVEILTPYHGRNFIGNVKDNSLVLRVQQGKISFLITGDCGKGCERQIREYYSPNTLRTTIYQVGDHGGDGVATELFLDIALPELSVISAAMDKASDVPSPGTLARLRKYGSRIMRTDYDGDVVVETDGKAYSVAISRGIPHIDLSGQGNYTFSAYSDCPFMAHVYGDVYYPIDCSFALNVEDENRVCFTSERQAIDAGLFKYGKC